MIWILLAVTLVAGQRASVPLGCPTVPLSTPTQTVGPDDFIELERTECFGTCPTYKVRVQGTGQVSWDGQTFVQYSGSTTATIQPELARSLLEKARSMGFWNLCAEYQANFTDAPTVYTTVRIADQQRRVLDYGNTGPEVLRDLEFAIDEVAGTYRWVHGEPQSNIFAFVMRNDPAAPPSLTSTVPFSSIPVVRYPITRFSDILNGPKPGMTALMRASGRGDLTEVRRLLSEKADPNAQDASGWTALMYATGARASSIDIVYSLIAAGADPNKKSAMGQTATMAAATALRDRGPVLRQIVGAGGDVQAADRNGQTALMFAATGIYGMQTVTETDSRYADYSDALSFLVTSGARSDAVDINGFTVFHQLDHLTKSSAGRITTYDAIREILSRKP